LFTDCKAWTGGNDVSVEGIYTWDHSKSNMVFTNWHEHEPSVTAGTAEEDCVEIIRTGEWNDKHCAVQNTFICEKAIL
jgi:hypothetical protein